MTEEAQGTVYLLHFERPFKHARHYMGYADNLERRLVEHSTGRGARLMKAVVEAGIDFVIARTWENCTEHDEARLKLRRLRKPSPAMASNHKRGSKAPKSYCPICKAEKKNGSQ